MNQINDDQYCSCEVCTNNAGVCMNCDLPLGPPKVDEYEPTPEMIDAAIRKFDSLIVGENHSFWTINKESLRIAYKEMMKEKMSVPE